MDCSGAPGLHRFVGSPDDEASQTLPPSEDFQRLPGYTPAELVSKQTRQLARMGVLLPHHCEGQPLVDPRELQ